MRLFEIEQMFGELPGKAGIAKIVWNNRRFSPSLAPTRNEDTIHLYSNDEDAQFFPLLDGKQFLIQVQVETVRREKGGEQEISHVQRVFFGGTDEQPFLVEMDPQVVYSLHKGENNFFEFIKPEGAKEVETAFGTKTIRQGDWFAVPVPLTYKRIKGMLRFFTDSLGEFYEKEPEYSLSGTRHKLITDRRVIEMEDNDNRLGCALIGEGILRAPDHEDRILKGPHAFFQTAHLINPQRAD